MLNHIRRLYAYTRWANDRVVAACEGIPTNDLSRDLGGSFPSVLATLGHVAASDWVWLERWHGRSPGGFPEDIDTSSLAAVLRHWHDVQDRRDEWIAALDEADLDGVLSYRNTAGEAYEGRLIDLLTHVVNHSTYHRGQVVTYLRQLGHAAPSTDLARWHRLGEPR